MGLQLGALVTLFDTELVWPLQVELVNIGGTDIVDGNHKLTLGLLWSIILHWQVRRLLRDLFLSRNHAHLSFGILTNFSGVLAEENNCFYSGLVNKGRPVFGFRPLSVGCLPQHTFSYVLSCTQSLSSVPRAVAEAFQAKHCVYIPSSILMCFCLQTFFYYPGSCVGFASLFAAL